MEVVDELMTPGCPQCAVKHLAAALSYLADGSGLVAGTAEVLVARAVVNLCECAQGYASHLDFAIGLLERAEAAVVETGGTLVYAQDLREVRTRLIRDGEAAVGRAVADLSSLADKAAFYWAHRVEAARELKEGFVFRATFQENTPEEILERIRAIRLEFFNHPEDPGKGGESDMATKKAGFAKKADPKAAKADPKAAKACKGGKCAGKKGCK